MRSELHVDAMRNAGVNSPNINISNSTYNHILTQNLLLVLLPSLNAFTYGDDEFFCEMTCVSWSFYALLLKQL